ncbi:GNAT family N-acetyltransferase [Aquitalea aquatica]|uniref:GNAT family N-acetyltransferase n=1 Tax=Aquitalea aquatica TaxID=3044273 RepID=A0A838XYF9_9NEIS|nr:GNAT family N-acetyltransferase [Aquitalea magnusonii]MBA4707416.1 GNAT family N-acetyltransferase [Aquitalea magnusonii]
MTIIIRPANYQDVPALTALTAEMGYPSGVEALGNRLTMLLGSPDLHQLWVAEIEGEVAGWLHAFWRPLLEAPAAVEIGGLAVGLRWRRRGAGRALVHVAERWALAKGATTVTLRSTIHREEAPDFYQNQGYQLSNAQNTFRKQLDDNS